MPDHILITNQIKSFNKKINVSSDKSISIRSVLLASQAVGISKITNLLESEDVLNALKTIKKLGIKYTKIGKTYKIEGFGLNGFNIKKKTIIDAGNSGTLARLILGLLVKTKFPVKLIGDKSLSKRDFSRVIKPLKLLGVNIKSKKDLIPIEITGTDFLRPITYYEKIGSAQVKSCLILAALNTPGKTIINSKKSRDHTEIMLKYLKYPIKVQRKKNYDKISVQGLNQFKSFNYDVPGDISSAAFFIVLTLLSNKSKIIIKNINVNKSRTGIITILNKMGANIKLRNRQVYNGENIANIHVESKKKLKAINCSPNLNSYAIDEFLIIFLLAAKASGVSSFKKLDELNKKESPRLKLGSKILNRIGIKTIINNGSIKIFGNPKLNIKKNIIIKNFYKDHRIFMTSVIAALCFGGKWIIHDVDSHKSSFPSFLKVLKKIGSKYSLI